jgi:aspartyl-tRNA(Asn)/glutamyl-tRNA(Gln) amidotransferase subunit C
MTGMASRISTADVAHVARLARLSLTTEELERFTEQLGAVLDHARDVEALDTEGVPPTAHPLPLRNVLREDEVVPCLDRDEVLAQAPATEANRFRVPRILGDAP